MKLIVQVPCYNEEKTLPLVIKSIPKRINGVRKVETMIIDDGSTDKTVEIAKKLGVNHIIQNNRNKGLAKTFATGVNEAVRLGADIIVNTDGDNQYPQHDIPKLIRPILEGKADIVIANRQTDKIEHFSPLKKSLQKLGSSAVRYLARSKIPDTVSGFRAYSRNAAISLNIVTDFSYCIETIIQSEYKRLAVTSINIKTNPPTRKSRLFKNMFEHIRHSTATMIRIYTMYQPLILFLIVGLTIFFIGGILGLRFLYYFLIGEGAGHIQSLILSSILILVGFQITMTGVVADLIGINRKLIEDTLKRIKLIELQEVNWSKIFFNANLNNGLNHYKNHSSQSNSKKVLSFSKPSQENKIKNMHSSPVHVPKYRKTSYLGQFMHINNLTNRRLNIK